MPLWMLLSVKLVQNHCYLCPNRTLGKKKKVFFNFLSATFHYKTRVQVYRGLAGRYMLCYSRKLFLLSDNQINVTPNSSLRFGGFSGPQSHKFEAYPSSQFTDVDNVSEIHGSRQFIIQSEAPFLYKDK